MFWEIVYFNKIIFLFETKLPAFMLKKAYLHIKILLFLYFIDIKFFKGVMLHLKAKDLIDRETEIHFAYHKSLKDITIEHDHDFFEIFLITKGSAVHKINKKRDVVKEGALVLIRPSDVHYYEKNNSEDCEMINLAFLSSAFFQLMRYFGEGFNSKDLIKSSNPPKTNLSKIEKDILTSRLEGLNIISREKKSKIRTEFRILISEIFSKYFRRQNYHGNEIVPGWLLHLNEEMSKKENFTGGINRMYQLSERSPEHLSRTFKKIFNETPTIFINKLRLNYAANLLANSDKSILVISMESGFENLSHFYHEFKKHFEITPRKFRAKHQKTVIPF